MDAINFNSINHGPYGNPHPQYDWLSGKNLNYTSQSAAIYCELLSFKITAANIDNSLSNFRYSFDLMEVSSDNFDSIVNYTGIIKISSDSSLSFLSQKNYSLFDNREQKNGYTTLLQCYWKDVTSNTDSSKVYEVHLVLYYPGNYKSVKIVHPWFYFSTNNTNPLDTFVLYKGAGVLKQTKMILGKIGTTFVTSDNFPYFSGYTVANSFLNQPTIYDKPLSGDKIFLSGNFGIKITGSGIFATKDAGSTWTEVTQKFFS